MLTFLVRRVLGMIPTLLLISIVCFLVIKLQPGSFLDQYLEDPRVSKETIASITQQLGLDQPAWVQYTRWITGIVTQGDFGFSFVNGRPVSSLIYERLGWTIAVAGSALLFGWLIAIPLGIFTALKPNGVRSTIANFIGYIGIATPDFLMVLLLISLALFLGQQYGFTPPVGGLFSPEYIDAPWSLAKLRDMLAHLWIPLIAIGLDGVAGLMRQMRASMLDVLNQDYMRTARAKGLQPRTVIWRHGVRNAINPLISIAGLTLPQLISGTIIASIVLNLPTIGPFLYDSLLNKDQYVAMTLLLFSAVLLLIGNLLADVALAATDPRIRFE